ncbi:helix-turn-helix transcriptional regulator [Nocardia australiensis]|uniref:helix-turn-helix transcriptional regulator n=1 Tax=Nocardia australiensis TaxID=2887191 RepID=UPI001D141890|nr:YafY family protein [Nocardia australiensis]
MDEPRRRDLPERMLRLLGLLQSRRTWSGTELAQRLRVTERTVRRDIERLRTLDYAVTGTTGTSGGYRLAAGSSIPPLSLEDEEVVAVAVGLAMASRGGISGIEDASLTALVKLEQIFPARLRPQLAAISRATSAAPGNDAAQVDPATLAVLAACCREHEIVRFDYRDRTGRRSARRVEPHSLVTLRGFWYLVAYDHDREDWRVFRIDRINTPLRTHRPAERRDLPTTDAVSFVMRSLAAASYRYTARLTVDLSAADVRAGIFGPIPGDIDDLGPGRCRIRLTAESPELVTQYIALVAALGAEFILDAPPDITDRLHQLGTRLGRIRSHD